MTAATAPGPGRLERRKARTRSAIISAASKLFHERGFEETAIQHIAELADTGVGTLYGYFDSKDEILREVLLTQRNEALEEYFASIDEKTPYIERAVAAIRTLANYLCKNRRILVAALQVGARNPRVDELQVPWLHEGFREMIEAGIEAGEFRPLPLDPTVRMLVGTTMLAMLGIATWSGEEDKPGTIAELEELVRGVLAR